MYVDNLWCDRRREEQSDMKILVTGATGFIGQWLVSELIEQQKHEIVALVRKESDVNKLKDQKGLSIIEVDYGNQNLSKKFKNVDVCIHLIGQMGEFGVPEEKYVDVNVNLTYKILNICEAKGVKQFIFCSTPGVQGFGNRMATEEQPYAPRNAYEKTKVMAEEEIIDFCKTSKIKYTIIRPDFVYGPGDMRRVKLYKNIKNKKFILTTSGKSFLHPTYITDVTQGFIKSIGNVNAYNEIFNISAGQDVNSLQYLKTIAECTESKLIHINIGYRISIVAASFIEGIYKSFTHREAFVTKNKIDFLALDHSTSNDKAQKLLGYIPQVDIEEGMRRTIAWCRDENLL